MRMDRVTMLLGLLAVLMLGCAQVDQGPRPSNVLLISIDDLNDWVGALGGHPMAKTPNIDRLCAQSVFFSSAYTAAPLCNPSRTAILTGIHPFTSGVYENKQPLRKSPVLQTAKTLPQYFRENGYLTLGSGKVFHYAHDTASWDRYWPSIDKIRPDDPSPASKPLHGMPVQGRFFDWGPISNSPSEMGDWKIAEWISAQLQQTHDQPFFMACGFYKPHLPWYLPVEYFERFPLDEIVVPKVKSDDLRDVPPIGRTLAKVTVPNREVAGDSLPGDHSLVLEHDQWKKGVQAYLAAIAFADDCLGKVLDALDQSRHGDNTIVVLWSDHGYHLGEKWHWRKSTLWEEGTRSLLAFRVPGQSIGKKVEWPVSLIDIFPTLVDLVGLPVNEEVQGRSLLPLLEDPGLSWDFPVITTFGYKNQSVRAKDWRYTRYADGGEELYHHPSDSMEWHNLADDPEYQAVKDNFASILPEDHALPIAPM